MTIERAMEILNAAGLHTQKIKALTLEIEGIHVSDQVRYVSEEWKEALAGNIVMISRERSKGNKWVLENDKHGDMNTSEDLGEIVDATLNYYNVT